MIRLKISVAFSEVRAEWGPFWDDVLTIVSLNTVRDNILTGRRKQSADGQAQLDVGGKAVNNLCAKRAAKFWT